MQIYFLLTEKCNLRCRMCIRGEKQNNEITFNDLKNNGLLETFQSHDIVITGGEPSLCKEFGEIVSAVSDVAKTVSICTNGIKNDYITNDFFKSNVKIQISIDGSANQHDNIRGLGTYEKTFQTVKKLEDLEIPYSIATVVNKSNKESLIDLASELAKLKNMTWWSVSMEMPFGEGSFEQILPVEDWNELVDKLLQNATFKMKVKKLFPFELFDKYKEKLDQMYEQGGLCNNCGSGASKIYIYPDLTVYPCTCLTKFPLGNLKEKKLDEILCSEQTLKFSRYKLEEDSKCYKCEYKKYCNGGCIGMSYQHFGKLGYGDVRCPKLR